MRPARSLLKAILRAPGNALIDSASHFTPRVGRVLRRDVSISSRFLPYAPEADAVYSESFVRDAWGSIMPIGSITPEAYDNRG